MALDEAPSLPSRALILCHSLVAKLACDDGEPSSPIEGDINSMGGLDLTYPSNDSALSVDFLLVRPVIS